MSLTKMVCGDDTLGKTDLLISNVNGLIDFSNFTDALKLSVNPSAMSVMESAPVIKIGERRVGKECRSRWSPYH